MSEYTPDREPDAWGWAEGYVCITNLDKAAFCTEAEGHVERDTPLWLVSTKDLDGIVRRGVAKALREFAEESDRYTRKLPERIGRVKENGEDAEAIRLLGVSDGRKGMAEIARERAETIESGAQS